VNGNHFQLAMLADNLNCWLMLFNREPQADATELRHTTLATSRLRFLFVAAKIWRHAGRTTAEAIPVLDVNRLLAEEPSEEPEYRAHHRLAPFSSA
jgi:hypothetical protein